MNSYIPVHLIEDKIFSLLKKTIDTHQDFKDVLALAMAIGKSTTCNFLQDEKKKSFIQEGDVMLHKIYTTTDHNDAPYYVGWVMVKKVRGKFFDAATIVDDSFKQYGYVFTRPILAMSMASLSMNIRIRIPNSFGKSKITARTQTFQKIPEEQYEDFFAIPL
jgi:hypothetical protein